MAWVRKKSALLVDYDNMVVKFGARFGEHIDAWVDFLERGNFDPDGRRRKFVLKRMYWNMISDVGRAQFEAAGFDVRKCRAIRDKGKSSSADFELTIDAVELRHAFRDIREVIILSFDFDFSSVLTHLKLHKINGWCLVEGTNEPAQNYRRLIRTVIERETFDKAIQFTPPGRWWQRAKKPAAPPAATTPATAKPAVAKVQPKPPPQPGKSKPAKPKAPPPRPKTASSVFDYAAAAQRVAAAASAQGKSRLPKAFVATALNGFPNFRTVGREPWLGCGSYPLLALRLVKACPDLESREIEPGRQALVYRPALPGEEQADTARTLETV